MNERQQSPKHKVAFLIPSLRAGGAEKVILSLAEDMASRGCDVDLLIACSMGDIEPRAESNVNIVVYGKKRTIYVLPELIRYLRLKKPYAFISSPAHINIIAIIAKLLSMSRVKVWVREATTPSRVKYERSYLREGVISLMRRRLYPFSDGIIAVSEGVREDLINKYNINAKKIRVIYNPINRDELLRKAEEPIKHPWLTQKCAPVVIMIGRLDEAKDYPTALRAFSMLLKRLCAKMIILGEGKMRAKMEALIENMDLSGKVDLPGYKSNPYSYIAASSVFMLTSEREGMPNALIEAVTLGVPVVSTDCQSGPNEILSGVNYGTLVPVGDADALAYALENALRHTERHNPPETFMERHSAVTIGSQYYDILSSGIS